MAKKARVVEPQQAFRRNLVKLRRLDRQLARKQKGSRNREKGDAKPARLAVTLRVVAVGPVLQLREPRGHVGGHGRAGRDRLCVIRIARELRSGGDAPPRLSGADFAEPACGFVVPGLDAAHEPATLGDGMALGEYDLAAQLDLPQLLGEPHGEAVRERRMDDRRAAVDVGLEPGTRLRPGYVGELPDSARMEERVGDQPACQPRKTSNSLSWSSGERSSSPSRPAVRMVWRICSMYVTHQSQKPRCSSNRDRSAGERRPSR